MSIADTIQARVTAEEIITTFEGPNNGSGPMWCFGSRTIARAGDTVFAVAPETGTDVLPLCNTRWVLYRRHDGGAWERVQANTDFDEREPCMLALQPGGRLVLSVNPAQERYAPMPDGRQGARCEPRLLEFDITHPERTPRMIPPVWDKPYTFCEHSYRALAADPDSGTLLLTNQTIEHGYPHAYSIIDGMGQPLRQGQLHFPMRGCYQQVAVQGRAVHLMAISDEIEPNPVWRAYKREVTGQEWDYDFRQLFYTWTPDLATTDFSPVLTVASRDETAGFIRNLDLWVDAQGAAHLLFLDRNIWRLDMRDRFFPRIPITIALKYARVEDGRVTARETLLETVERERTPGAVAAEMAGPAPDGGTFHATPDGRLFVLWYQAGDGAGLYLRQIVPALGAVQRVPLETPLTTFFAACPRNGCAPSFTIDLYGSVGGENAVRYAQIQLR